MPPHKERWSVIVHGGARAIPEEDRPACEQGCLMAVRAAATILATGGTAVDAVVAATRLLEDAPHFNAGHSSVRNAAGEIEMDAAIMDGETLNLGGVAAIRDVRSPISVARALLQERSTLLVGEGAMQFAAEVGAEPMLNRDVAGPAHSHSGDTVGCVARDIRGHVAAAGSTGGIAGKPVGRVGDTPLPGCGLYADDEIGAVALSGDGESISRTLLAANSLGGLPQLTPRAAADAAIQRLGRIGGEAGAILIDREGEMGIAHNSPQFSVALAASWIKRPVAASDAAALKEWFE